MDSYELRKMAEEISDEQAREDMQSAIIRWEGNAPARSVRCECPGCGRKRYNRTGRLCEDCMRTLVSSAIARHKPEEGEVTYIPGAAHWLNAPFVHMKSGVPESAFFIPQEVRDHYPKGVGGYSTNTVFEHLVFNFLKIALSGYPAAAAVPAEQPASIFGATRYGSSRGSVQAKTPTGFREAFRDLAFFVAWAVTRSEQDGRDEGQNLLVGMASGTLTNVQMTERSLDLEARAGAKAAEMAAKANRRR